MSLLAARSDRAMRPDRAARQADVEEYLCVRNVSKNYGRVRALGGVSFSLRQGEMLALLGPSGCGKSTLLNVISGFLSADTGSILVDGKDVSQVPPHRRDMPMVFQSYALFPHMTVEENVGFGLKQRRVKKDDRAVRVREALEMVQLPHVLDRYPSELSGGQQQRVALARCLVVRPPVLLLDEPLSNLDAQLRADMRDDMNEILRASGTTSLFVTHDQSEGLAIADRVLVLRAGLVEQEGEPEEVFDAPVSRFTADFIGVANLWLGTLTSDAGEPLVQTPLGPVRPLSSCTFAPGNDVVVAVRPDRVNVLAHGDVPSTVPGLRVTGRVTNSSYLGRQRRLRIEHEGATVIADVSSDLAVGGVGEVVEVCIPRNACRLVTP